VRSHTEGYPRGGRIETHAHTWDQLTLITGGSAFIQTDASCFLQPDRSVFWLPAGVTHAIEARRPFVLHVLYFEAGALTLGVRPFVAGLSQLARELILFLASAPALAARGPAHEDAVRLLVQVLPRRGAPPLTLPRPVDARARALAAHFMASPHDRRTVDVLAAEIAGASVRTLERCFLAETGLSIVAWRRQLRLIMAFGLLQGGLGVQAAAEAVGYRSVAAFSTAFRTSFGDTPSRLDPEAT
jgi:AraC-like DNA-binding protein